LFELLVTSDLPKESGVEKTIPGGFGSEINDVEYDDST